MADLALSGLVLASVYKQGISEQANRSARALQFLSVVDPSNPAGPQFVIDGYGATASAVAEGATVSAFDVDSRQAASLSWARYRSSFRITGTALRAARISGNPVAAERQELTALKNAVMSVVEAIGTDFYSGSGANAIQGLAESVNDDNGTYANVSRLSGLGGFKGNVSDPGVATAISFAQIDADLNKCYIRSGRMPNLAFCHPDVFAKIAALHTNLRQGSIDLVSPASGPIVLRSGQDGIEHGGCTFVMDRLATNGRIFYVNTDHLWFEAMPMANVSGEWSVVPGTDGEAVLPLGMGVKSLAQVGDLEAAMVLSELQLVNDRPNAHCIRKNILTT